MKAYRGNRCATCGKQKGDPVHAHVTPRMRDFVERLLKIAWPRWMWDRPTHHFVEPTTNERVDRSQHEMKRLKNRLKRKGMLR